MADAVRGHGAAYSSGDVLFFLPIALIALIMHLKSGLVNKALVKKCIFGGVVGAVLGTIGSQIIANDMLRKLYALFLLAFGLRELFSKSRENEDNNRKRVSGSENT